MPSQNLQLSTSQKWEKYKANINTRRRNKYRCNPSPVKAKIREAYRCNPSPIKKRVNQAYKLNPSPVKARKREAYRLNPSPVKERNRLAYHVDPTLAKARSKSAYYNDHECTKHKRRQTYNWHKENLIDRRSLERLVACAVSKKYKKLHENFPKNNFRLYVSNIIKNLSRKKITSSDVEVEHLVQSCMYFRDMNRKKFIHAFKTLKLLVLATLSKLQDTSDDPYEIILGPSMHTASSESFFPASTYHKEALDNDGNLDITKFPVNDVGKKQKNWTCVSGLCKLDNKPEIASNVCKIYNSIGECDPIEARHYIRHMDDCDHPESHDKSLAGHSELCHLDDDACKSKFLYLRRLAPHFPNVRQLVNMIYNVKRTDTQVSRIDQALQTGNVDVLREISAEQKCAYQSFDVGRISSIDENNVLKTFMKAYVSYKKRCSEFAEFPCMSCNKLCFKRECVLLERCRIPVTGNAWKFFTEYLDVHTFPDDSLSAGYICKFCIDKFRNGTIPSRCMLNGLSFDNVPSEIIHLNQHERVLIQRAKAFQVVTKM